MLDLNVADIVEAKRQDMRDLQWHLEKRCRRNSTEADLAMIEFCKKFAGLYGTIHTLLTECSAYYTDCGLDEFLEPLQAFLPENRTPIENVLFIPAIWEQVENALLNRYNEIRSIHDQMIADMQHLNELYRQDFDFTETKSFTDVGNLLMPKITACINGSISGEEAVQFFNFAKAVARCRVGFDEQRVKVDAIRHLDFEALSYMDDLEFAL